MTILSKNFSMSDFDRLPRRQQQACFMLIGCALVFLLVVVVSSVMIFGGKASDEIPDVTQPTIDNSYDKGQASIAESEYSGTVLQKTADAGQKYLDDTLWIGDSNTVRMYRYEQIALENYMGLEGMGIEGVSGVQCVYFSGDSTVYTIPQAIKKVQPRRIIMTFGTNNADGSISANAFIATYKSAIKEVQAAYPYADLIIGAIPPVASKRSYPNVSMQNIDAFNKELVAMAKELDLPFLNTGEILKDATGFGKTEYLYEDGLHFNAKGIKALLEYARTHAYETQDRRPSVSNAPKRAEPPAPPSSEETSSSEHKHVYKDEILKAATCKEPGLKRRVCEAGDHTLEEIIPKLTTHTWGATDPTTGKRTCTVCGTVEQDPAWVAPKPQEPASSSQPAPTPPPVSSSQPAPNPPPASSSAPPVESAPPVQNPPVTP